jgi:hypothetical protein
VNFRTCKAVQLYVYTYCKIHYVQYSIIEYIRTFVLDTGARNKVRSSSRAPRAPFRRHEVTSVSSSHEHRPVSQRSRSRSLALVKLACEVSPRSASYEKHMNNLFDFNSYQSTLKPKPVVIVRMEFLSRDHSKTIAAFSTTLNNPRSGRASGCSV